MVPAGTPQRGGLELFFDGLLPDLGRLSRHAGIMPRAMRLEYPLAGQVHLTSQVRGERVLRALIGGRTGNMPQTLEGIIGKGSVR